MNEINCDTKKRVFHQINNVLANHTTFTIKILLNKQCIVILLTNQHYPTQQHLKLIILLTNQHYAT